jgi:protein gp37
MNKQQKTDSRGNITGMGIEWCSYTWNPIGGCKHACRWTMPDGSTAKCYAEEVAAGIARNNYQFGFDAHYWKPQLLSEPLKLKEPARIFLDSMSDLMGAWVPEDQIKAVLQVARQAEWHTFQLLTKNAPRLKQFVFPDNVWVGVSSAPDQMLGHTLDQNQQERYMHKALSTLSGLHSPVTWMSFEPLSWGVAPIVAQYPNALKWAVIGAASNGSKYYQPNPRHVEALLKVLDGQGVPVFFKGNLNWSPWREEFPGEAANYQTPMVYEQAALFGD